MKNTTVADLARSLEAIAPAHLAEDWDNVGLLVGNLRRRVKGPVLLAIDLTEAVLGEALEAGASTVVAYHPPIFAARKDVRSDTGPGRVLLGAIEGEIALLSPHTALDAAPGGLGDWLADLVGGASGTDRRALVSDAGAPARRYKVVVFVPRQPPGVIDEIRRAGSDAGAGRIGGYEMCSFASPGTGSFLGGAATSPAVGSSGALERVEEHRLEMVCPSASLSGVVEAIRSAHPYEEPAMDVYPLVEPGAERGGAGRAVTLKKAVDAGVMGARVRDSLGLARVRVADAGCEIRRVGVCPGAGASLLDAAVADGCEAFVTGEMRHHDVLSALDRGCSVVLGGHTNTERGYLPILAERLGDAIHGVEFRVSERDVWPLSEV